MSAGIGHRVPPLAETLIIALHENLGAEQEHPNQGMMGSPRQCPKELGERRGAHELIEPPWPAGCRELTRDLPEVDISHRSVIGLL